MKTLLVVAGLLGMVRGLGGGGCPLNYGDSCGWMETSDGDFCFKPVHHGKSFMDASELCWALGTYECNSNLLTVDDVDSLVLDTDPKYLPRMVRLNALAADREADWTDIDGDEVRFGAGKNSPDFDDDSLPGEYEDHHVLSAVWDVRGDAVTGGTPVQERVAYVCTSCVAESTECPLICEFCIPHMPVDGQWEAWDSWNSCYSADGCSIGYQNRWRTCEAPRWGGDDGCYGPSIQGRNCLTGSGVECAVDGEWGDWRTVSECGPLLSDDDPLCGAGEMVQKRYCDDPPPANGGAGCSLGQEQEQYVSCPLDRPDCPSGFGAWCSWESWTGCSATCGPGVNERSRACECPPQSGGFIGFCGLSNIPNSDVADEHEVCREEKCEIAAGEWSSWASWSGCTDLCTPYEWRRQQEVRRRRCSNALSDHALCVGDKFAFRDCDPAAQPPDCSDEFSVMAVGGVVMGGQVGASGFELPYSDDSTLLSLSLAVTNCSEVSESLAGGGRIHGLAGRSDGTLLYCGGSYGQKNRGAWALVWHESVNVTDVCEVSGNLTDGWTNSSISLVEPRAHAAVAQLTDSDFMVIGGGAHASLTCTTEFYYADEGGFIPGPELPGGTLYYACAVALDPDTVVVLGGILNGYKTDRVMKYTISTNTWVRLADMNVKRYGSEFGCAAFRDGDAADAPLRIGAFLGARSRTVEVYDVATDAWNLDEVGVAPVYPRRGSSVFEPVEKKFYSVGGSKAGSYSWSAISAFYTFEPGNFTAGWSTFGTGINSFYHSSLLLGNKDWLEGDCGEL